MSIWGQIVSEIVAQLCLQNSIQTLLNFFWVDPKNNLHNCLEFSQPRPLMFISGYANTENVFYCLNTVLGVYSSRDQAKFYIFFSTRMNIFTGRVIFFYLTRPIQCRTLIMETSLLYAKKKEEYS